MYSQEYIQNRVFSQECTQMRYLCKVRLKNVFYEVSRQTKKPA